MDVTEALLDSWARQCQMLDHLVSILTPELLSAKPSDDGWNSLPKAATRCIQFYHAIWPSHPPRILF